MMSAADIEGRARRLVACSFTHEGVDDIIGDLMGAERGLVLQVAAKRFSDLHLALNRLANAAGFRGDGDTVDWLLERGLIRRDANGYYIVPKIGPVLKFHFEKVGEAR